jgi:putative membrane protein
MEVNMWHWGEHMHWGIFEGEWLMILLWLAVAALLIWGIITISKNTGRSSATLERQKPIDIAKERYAKGEITREEFKQIKQDLQDVSK